MANPIKKELKRRLCARDLDAGDVVRVPDGRWDSLDHPVGGPGKWAIFVGRSRNKFVVRPLQGDGVTGKPHEVDTVEHIDDVVMDVALREYYASRGRKRAS